MHPWILTFQICQTPRARYRLLNHDSPYLHTLLLCRSVQTDHDSACRVREIGLVLLCSSTTKVGVLCVSLMKQEKVTSQMNKLICQKNKKRVV